MTTGAVEPLPKPVTLAAIKAEPKLKDMALVKYARLSVQPVTAERVEGRLQDGRGEGLIPFIPAKAGAPGRFRGRSECDQERHAVRGIV